MRETWTGCFDTVCVCVCTVCIVSWCWTLECKSLVICFCVRVQCTCLVLKFYISLLSPHTVPPAQRVSSPLHHYIYITDAYTHTHVYYYIRYTVDDKDFSKTIFVLLFFQIASAVKEFFCKFIWLISCARIGNSFATFYCTLTVHNISFVCVCFVRNYVVNVLRFIIHILYNISYMKQKDLIFIDSASIPIYSGVAAAARPPVLMLY